MLPLNMSVDIVKYLIEKKEMSVDDIAKAMDSTDKHIKKIISKKETLTAEDLKSYLKNTESAFWELSYESGILDQLPKKTSKKIMICQQLSQHIKKNKK